MNNGHCQEPACPCLAGRRSDEASPQSIADPPGCLAELRRFAPTLAMTMIFSILFSISALAGTPSKCVVTIGKVELKSETGEWVTVIEPDRQVDVVAEEAGLSFFNTGRVPEGDYVNFRVFLSRSFKVAGGDAGNFTAEGGEIALGGITDSVGRVPGRPVIVERIETWGRTSPGGEMLMRADLTADVKAKGEFIEITAVADFSRPVAVQKGALVSVFFAFDLTGTLRYAGPNAFGAGVPSTGIMYFLPPSRIAGLSLTIGTDSRELGPDAVRYVF